VFETHKQRPIFTTFHHPLVAPFFLTFHLRHFPYFDLSTFYLPTSFCCTFF